MLLLVGAQHITFEISKLFPQLTNYQGIEKGINLSRTSYSHTFLRLCTSCLISDWVFLADSYLLVKSLYIWNQTILVPVLLLIHSLQKGSSLWKRMRIIYKKLYVNVLKQFKINLVKKRVKHWTGKYITGNKIYNSKFSKIDIICR